MTEISDLKAGDPILVTYAATFRCDNGDGSIEVDLTERTGNRGARPVDYAKPHAIERRPIALSGGVTLNGLDINENASRFPAGSVLTRTGLNPNWIYVRTFNDSWRSVNTGFSIRDFGGADSYRIDFVADAPAPLEF